MRFLSRIVFLVLSFGVDGCQRPLPPLSPDAQWLSGPRITADDLERILAFGGGDPEVTSLLTEAKQRLGGGTMQGLAARFSICEASRPQDGGFTSIESDDLLLSRPLEELAFGTLSAEASADISAALAKPGAREKRVLKQPDFYLVERTTLPTICLVGTLPARRAYETLVHELVHALRLDPHDKVRATAGAADEASYLRALALMPGGEVDAYTASSRAMLRGNARGGVSSPVLAAFDPQTAQLRVSREALADIVLAPRPGGMGYADGIFRDAPRAGALESQQQLASLRSVVGQTLVLRRQEIEIHTKNVAIHEGNAAAHRHNAAIAARTNDAAVAAKSQAGLAEAEAGRVRSLALVAAARASESRLTMQLGAQLDNVDGALPALTW